MQADRIAAFVACVFVLLSGWSGEATGADLRVWNGDLVAPHLDWAYETSDGAELQPVRIVAARNGVFSGKVVVGCNAPIKGLRAAVSKLASEDGSSIPPEQVALSFPRWRQQGDWRVIPDAISQFDTLHPSPAESVPLITKSVKRKPVELGGFVQQIP